MKSLEKDFIPYFPGHLLLFSGGIRLAMLYSIMYRACKTDDERVWGQTSFIFCPDLLSGGLNSPSDYCARVYFIAFIIWYGPHSILSDIRPRILINTIVFANLLVLPWQLCSLCNIYLKFTQKLEI